MRGVYSISQNFSSATAASTLIHLQVASTNVIEILSASATNRNNESNEQLEFVLQKTSSSAPTGGTDISSNIVKNENGDATSTTTIRESANTGGTYGGVINRQGVSSLAGYFFDPIPETRPIVPPSNGIALRVLTTTFTALDLAVEIVFREIG